MLEWALALSSSAAAALVAAAATDAWAEARAGAQEFFRPLGKKKMRQLTARLDSDASSLVIVEDTSRAELEEHLVAMWATRIHDVLEEHPETAERLREWVRDVEDRLDSAKSMTQTNVARESGTVFAVVQGTQNVEIGSRTDPWVAPRQNSETPGGPDDDAPRPS